MRLSEQRIENIALAITDRLAEDELVDLTIDEDDLAHLIGDVILKDLKLEDERRLSIVAKSLFRGQDDEPDEAFTIAIGFGAFRRSNRGSSAAALQANRVGRQLHPQQWIAPPPAPGERVLRRVAATIPRKRPSRYHRRNWRTHPVHRGAAVPDLSSWSFCLAYSIFGQLREPGDLVPPQIGQVSRGSLGSSK